MYKSNQNRIVERTIQQTKNNTRAILAKAKLLIEFWDKAIEANIYLQNQLPRREELWTNLYIFSLEKVFISQKG